MQPIPPQMNHIPSKINIFSTFACLLILSAFIGCNNAETPERDLGLFLQTDASLYTLAHQNDGLTTEISYTYDNQTGEAVYLVNCNGAFLLKIEREHEGVWSPIWWPILNECLSPPIIIDAGETYNGKLTLWGALPGSDIGPQFESEPGAGNYRLVWIDALTSFQDDTYPFGEQLPLSQRVSNTFQLEIE